MMSDDLLGALVGCFLCSAQPMADCKSCGGTGVRRECRPHEVAAFFDELPPVEVDGEWVYPGGVPND